MTQDTRINADKTMRSYLRSSACPASSAALLLRVVALASRGRHARARHVDAQRAEAPSLDRRGVRVVGQDVLSVQLLDDARVDPVEQLGLLGRLGGERWIEGAPARLLGELSQRLGANAPGRRRVVAGARRADPVDDHVVAL